MADHFIPAEYWKTGYGELVEIMAMDMNRLRSLEELLEKFVAAKGKSTLMERFFVRASDAEAGLALRRAQLVLNRAQHAITLFNSK